MFGTCSHCERTFTKKYDEQIYCSVLCSNRSNLNHKNNVVLPSRYSEELAEFFGILLGDGSVTKYYMKIYLNLAVEREYASFVHSLAEKLFVGATVTLHYRPARGTAEVQISSVDVSRYLMSVGFDPKTRTIPSWITKNETYRYATTRGLFDTEGTMGIKYFSGKTKFSFYKQLTVTNTNPNILSFIKESLVRKGLRPSRTTKKNIYISNGLDIRKYMADIGSNNPKMLSKLQCQQIGKFTYGGVG